MAENISIRNKVPPCKGCTDREVACHSTCERYKNWKIESDKLREKTRKQKLLTRAPEYYHYDSVSRQLRKKHLK